MTKVGFVSLGCPKNLVDSEVMMGILARGGYELTPRADEAEVLVVNTCSFIEAAQKESVEAILEMAEHKRFGAAKKLIVAGCLVERFRAQILEQVPEVDAVVGTGEVERILEAVEGDLRVLPSQPPVRISAPGSGKSGEGGRAGNHADWAGHHFVRRRSGPARGAGTTARKARASGRPSLGAIPVRVSQSCHTEIAGHACGASAACEIPGHAAATRQPERSGAHEARFEWRCVLEIAGAHARDDSRRCAAHVVHRRLPWRDGKRFRGTLRFCEGGEAGLARRVRVFGRGQRRKLRAG